MPPPPPPPPSHIFSPSSNTTALITLILIENSQLLFSSWNTLSQHYLPTLLGTIRIANPVIPIPVLWLTTAPVGDDPSSIRSPPPRQYNQLPELKFSFSPDNKISSRIIIRATELMLEAATQFQGGPVSFHLFVVAASSPLHTRAISAATPAQMDHSEWRALAQRIAQLGIHCHMILPTSQDMSPMHELFNASLHLQGHTQVQPWFPISSDHTFLLSGNPSPSSPPSHPQSDAPFPSLEHPAIDPIEKTPIADSLQNHSLGAPRPPVLRHQSFPPQDVQSAPSPPAQSNPTPSLVSSLQKFHGLSRKKLYSAQAPRQPFVREEPVRTKYKSTPTPLSIPVGSQHVFPEDGRVLGKSKVERGRRADRPSHVADASSSCSPVRRNPWGHVPSPDIGSSPSSPTASLSSHPTASPTISLFPELAGYPTSPPTTSATFSLSPIPISEANFGDPSGGYLSISQQFQTPTTTAIPISPQAPMLWTPVPKPSPVPTVKSAGTPTANRRHSQEIAHMQSLSAMSSKYRLDVVSGEPRAVAKNTQKVKDAGDVPFIFSPEIEAATAARLKAVLQSTTPVMTSGATMNQFTAFTSENQLNYAVSEDAYVLSQTPAVTPTGYAHMQDARPTGWVNGNVHCGDGKPHPRFVGSTSSSSLQGWAG